MMAPDAFGEQHVALGDRADAAVDDLHPHFAGAELGQRVGQRLGRAALVGLDDDAQLRDRAFLELPAEVLEARGLLRAPALRLALEPLAALRDVTRLDRVGHHAERVARRRHALEPEDLHRERRPALP